MTVRVRNADTGQGVPVPGTRRKARKEKTNKRCNYYKVTEENTAVTKTTLSYSGNATVTNYTYTEKMQQ